MSVMKIYEGLPKLFKNCSCSVTKLLMKLGITKGFGLGGEKKKKKEIHSLLGFLSKVRQMKILVREQLEGKGYRNPFP